MPDCEVGGSGGDSDIEGSFGGAGSSLPDRACPSDGRVGVGDPGTAWGGEDRLFLSVDCLVEGSVGGGRS